MQIEIKTTQGQTFMVNDPEYNAKTIEAELNDTTNRMAFIAIGDVVLNRNSIMSIAPVSQETASTTA